MKRIFGFICILILTFISFSCISVPIARNRTLELSGETFTESDFGGVERWYAVDKKSSDSVSDEIRLQVGYFREGVIGFILYENGTIGELANFTRQGIELRWDWGHYVRDGEDKYRYAFVIQPDGTGMYYDFINSIDGFSSPRGIYKTRKF